MRIELSCARQLKGGASLSPTFNYVLLAAAAAAAAAAVRALSPRLRRNPVPTQATGSQPARVGLPAEGATVARLRVAHVDTGGGRPVPSAGHWASGANPMPAGQTEATVCSPRAGARTGLPSQRVASLSPSLTWESFLTLRRSVVLPLLSGAASRWAGSHPLRARSYVIGANLLRFLALAAKQPERQPAEPSKAAVVALLRDCVSLSLSRR